LGRCQQKQRGLRGLLYDVAGPPLLNGRCTSLLRAPVSEMTYTVSSGMLNSTIPYQVKVKVVDLYSASTRSIFEALGYSTHCQGITQFYLYTLLFIHKRNELCLPLPSQPQLVLIYRPRTGPEGWKAE